MRIPIVLSIVVLLSSMRVMPMLRHSLMYHSRYHPLRMM